MILRMNHAGKAVTDSGFDIEVDHMPPDSTARFGGRRI